MKTTSPSTQQRVLFSVSAQPGNQVYLSGTFNNWEPDSIKMKDTGNGHFQHSVIIPKGRHEYKFIINDEWVADPECPHWNANEHGSLNSVIQVTN